ncbi:MAG: 4Fe-4S binding protein [bacterium]
MCEFCHKHGEGRKWYLEAKNYGDDLMSDARRRKMIAGFFSEPADVGQIEARMDKLNRMPGFVRRAMTWNVTRRTKNVHFGQVVPIEDVERIFGFVNSITRFACVCRHATVGGDQRFCYGVSLSPNGGEFGKLVRELDKSFLDGVATAGAETMTKEQALAAFRDHEKDGLCHTVWTFMTPFIGGVCNCDRADCLAMRFTVTRGVPIMFRAEYVAELDPELCNGCRSCMRACQFGAIGYGKARGKVMIDARKCYGCGVCRAVCPRNAVTLRDRASVPAVASLWL